MYKYFIWAALLYVAGCVVALHWYRYAINPDGVSYISIAQKYASGNFSEAINGYWGPLLSWLLAPFIWLHKDAQIAARLIFMGSGVITLFLCVQIAKKWKVKASIEAALLFSLVPVLVFWSAAGPITPDLLVLSLYLAYLSLQNRKPSYMNAVLLGGVGAIGYFSKAYFLPFFVAHSICMVLYRIKFERTGVREIRYWSVSIIALCIFVLPWVGMISAKYGEITYSTSGAYNFSLLNPAKPGHPLNYIGLTAPFTDSALSAWEDPSYIPRASWNPFSSKTNIAAMVRTVFDNGKRVGAALFEFSAFSMAFWVFALLVLVQKGRKARSYLFLYMSAGMTYVLGYLVLLAEYRYFWPIFASLTILFCLMLNDVRVAKYKKSVARSLYLLAVLSIVVTPLTQLYYQRNKHIPQYYQSMVIKPYLPKDARLAADNFDAIKHCYYLRLHCLGVINPNNTVHENKVQLKDKKADFVLITETDSTWRVPGYLEEYEEVTTVGRAILFKRSLSERY